MSYQEIELIDAITAPANDFLGSVPECVVLYGGDVNRLDLNSVVSALGLSALVDFPTRGQATLDNCLTKPDLFNPPFSYKKLIKTDHTGVVLPPGRKLKPFCTKFQFRDCREHRKLQFAYKIQSCDRSHVIEADDVDCPVDRLNDTLHDIMHMCFPLRTVTLSTRDPPWISPLLKYLLKKRSKAAFRGKEAKTKELTVRISGIIAENRKN